MHLRAFVSTFRSRFGPRYRSTFRSTFGSLLPPGSHPQLFYMDSKALAWPFLFFSFFSFSSSLRPPPCLCVRAWWLVFGVSRFVGRSWLLVALRFRALVAVRCGVRLSSFSFPFRTYNVGPVVPCYELYLKSDLENIISSHIPAHLEVRAGHFGSSFRHTLAPSSWYWCNSHHGG